MYNDLMQTPTTAVCMMPLPYGARTAHISNVHGFGGNDITRCPVGYSCGALTIRASRDAMKSLALIVLALACTGGAAMGEQARKTSIAPRLNLTCPTRAN